MYSFFPTRKIYFSQPKNINIPSCSFLYNRINMAQDGFLSCGKSSDLWPSYDDDYTEESIFHSFFVQQNNDTTESNPKTIHPQENLNFENKQSNGNDIVQDLFFVFDKINSYFFECMNNPAIFLTIIVLIVLLWIKILIRL